MSERVKPEWPEGQWPTAAEWCAWFLSNPSDQQEQIAERVLASSQEAALCWQAGHDGLLRELENTRSALRSALTDERLVAAETSARRYRNAWRSARRYRRNVRAAVSEYFAGRESA